MFDNYSYFARNFVTLRY